MPDPEFADDADRLPGLELQRDAVHRFHIIDDAAHEALTDRKPDAQIFRLEHDGRLRRRRIRGARGLRGEQRLGVRVLWIGEDARGGPGLDDLALLHDADVVGDTPHEAQVVGDEQHRHAIGLAQPIEQHEDLRLHGHVERRRRLVGDEQIGLVGERHRDHDALALSA